MGAEQGMVLVGERVLPLPQGYRYIERTDEGREALDRATAALRELGSAGITSILDVSTIESRDAPSLREAADAAGVTVQVCTGVGCEASGVSAVFRDLPATGLADVFIAELADSVHDGDLRAAAVVVEAGPAASDFDRRSVLAAAFAHAETGAAVFARAEPAQLVDLVHALSARGVEPTSIVALDVDRETTTWGTLAALDHRGVGVAFGSNALDEAARAALLAYALRRFGPERVFVATGVPLASAEGSPAAALARLRDSVGSYGVAAADFDTALRTGPR